MKRIDITYGGNSYSVGGRDLSELQAAVLRGHTDGGLWLEVNDGEGAERPAYLLIAPGIDIALIPIPGDTSPDSDVG
jgi:hypothetical protein